MLLGASGGNEWSPPAYSPLTHAAYILGMNQLRTFSTGGNDDVLHAVEDGAPTERCATTE